ncbi:MAG: peptidylprolyl isomerase A [Gammaproteobacteria bacterium]|jgi:cyclophilin family peptidyl-prolyl cis-trans isomerase|nr:peptidylprolyl isomerase A [Gammaproteobacteria bacterium]MBT4492843.1 peptidylprolyl isomerase A [Gammaproteobacteria bacterium]MBT7371487.1 peptidylprolyl isomerase A [Gammaproteobacteria bacterium]
MKSLSVAFTSFILILVSFGTFAETKVVVKTSLGDITVALNEEKAPVTVESFLSYVDDDSYNDTIFHRVIEGFMAQGGGLYSDMSEAEDKGTVKNEADNGLGNKRGTIAMARMNAIDSASRQFFINVSNNAFLNHTSKSCSREDEAKTAAQREKGISKPQKCKSFGYTVFGKVVAGMKVVDQIENSKTKTAGMYQDVPVTPIVILSVERVAEESESS